MTALTLSALRADGQAFTEEIARESYLAHSGFKPTAELAPIYEKYSHILGRDALDFTLDLFRSTEIDGDSHRSARYLLEWQLESQASRTLAALDEAEIELENTAYVETPDGRRVQYQAAAIDIANEPNRAQRLALDAARASFVQREHAPLRRERLQREKDFVESLQIAPTYNEAFGKITGIDLPKLAQDCQEFLSQTQPIWDDTLPSFLKASLGINVSDAMRADALALWRAREYDSAFPATSLEESVRKQLNEMRLDPDAQGRIVYDLADRPGKRSRAFCAPTRVPQEVYLVLRPHGGQRDYMTLLHEAGHALHFANAREDYPFEFRWLGDNSVTESYAMLFDHRMQDRGWLTRYTELGKSTLGAFLRLAGFEQLHYLRRYCAKLVYEFQVYGGDVELRSAPELYVDALTRATSFQYDAADAFVDFDTAYYSARYLRAWQLQSLLNETLVNRFNEDWFRNPAAGPWMISELLSEAQRETADEIAARLSAPDGLSFAPLIRSIEVLLES